MKPPRGRVRRKRRIYHLIAAVVVLQLGIIVILFLVGGDSRRGNWLLFEDPENTESKSRDSVVRWLEKERVRGKRLDKFGFKSPIGWPQKTPNKNDNREEGGLTAERANEVFNWMQKCPRMNQENLYIIGNLDDNAAGRPVKLANYTIAVKMFKMDRMIVEDVFQEMEIQASVNHANIVRFLGLLIDRNELDDMAVPRGFAMEYFPGEQLETILDELASPPHTPVSLKNRIIMALQMASALGHLHDNGIIHFDVKPEQFLVQGFPDGEITVKLIDFGIALRQNGSRYVDASLEGGTRWRGTNQYIAPEIVLNEKNVTEKIDVHSFGVVLWELYTRRVPFIMHDVDGIIDAIRVDAPFELTIPEDCEPKWRRLIEDCRRWRPDDRPTFHEIVHRLLAYAEELGLDTDIENLIRAEGSLAYSSDSEHKNTLYKANADIGRADSTVAVGSVGELESLIEKRGGDGHNTTASHNNHGNQLEKYGNWRPVIGSGREGLQSSNRIYIQDVDLGEKSGEGMYGAVYKTEYTVAIRVLEDTQRAVNEMRAHCLVGRGHANVAQFIGLIVKDEPSTVGDPIGYVTAHSGAWQKHATLQDVFRTAEGKGLQRGFRLQIAYQIASGLSHIHANGVVHLAIAPPNILLSDGIGGQVNAQIDDFSNSVFLSEIPSRERKYQLRSEQRKFVAPEALTGSSDVTDRADVFSLGVLMWEMCGTAFPLFRDARNHDNMEPGLSSLNCDDDWKGIAVACINIDPHQRPSATDIAHWLQSLDTK